MSNSSADMLPAQVTKILSLKGKTLYITIGNSLRGDDGIGPYIAENARIKNKLGILINAGEKIESILNYTDFHKPSKIVLIDGANFSGDIGEIRIIPEESLSQFTLSTHQIPLSLITQMVRTDYSCELFFIGIQVGNVALGEGMNQAVKSSGDEIIGFLNGIS